MSREYNKTNINLLPDEFRESGKLRRVRNFLQRTSFAVLGIYLVLLLGIFGVNLFFANVKKNLTAESKQLTTEVEALAAKEKLLLTTQERIKIAQSIFNDPTTDPTDLAKVVLNSVSQNITVDRIKADKDEVSLSAYAQDSRSLGVFFDQLRRLMSGKQEKSFTGITLDNLSLLNNNRYSFSLSFR